ncbi:hypothetical protein TREMEDRAFT_58912 [Tremella mesenterica DSM 1558]|uniref:uncharacterized protein n=1 Tax=Tremella mesenterica (strain ATCC 24925 / CBS 8224 / DSM 1558 / NBRC 9311 / NRRL Y-6157 / RJB 2259-6 / UBC 559-6) TaxID=578456 RepID=UPI0003F49440|nr:uncharacterized protein TREMEDRAFT_58912 [Tremella mesenterica DSM 1558]EIW72745.1 hypothetical protein TREMEDRAFT_58912 [Tremella mesenterica DSM 1558]
MSPIFPLWDFSHWHAVDDRVRGGSSISHLEPYTLSPSIAQSIDDEKGSGARFHGTLDITTLGGAGFASQRCIFGPSPLNLARHKYSGIILDVLCDPAIPTLASNHPSNFTLVLQTTISSKVPQKPRTPSDPQAARLAYEADFCIPTDLDFDNYIQGETGGQVGSTMAAAPFGTDL